MQSPESPLSNRPAVDEVFDFNMEVNDWPSEDNADPSRMGSAVRVNSLCYSNSFPFQRSPSNDSCGVSAHTPPNPLTDTEDHREVPLFVQSSDSGSASMQEGDPEDRDRPMSLSPHSAESEASTPLQHGNRDAEGEAMWVESSTWCLLLANRHWQMMFFCRAEGHSKQLPVQSQNVLAL